MSWLSWKNLKYSPNRNLHSSPVNREKEVTPREELGNSGPEDLNSVPLRPLDKRLFVWSGKYKRIEDVPNKASRASVAKAQSLCRIKACNYMIIAVIIAAGAYIMSGKRDAQRGINLSKMNEEWHKEYNRKYEEEHRKELKP